MVKDRLPELLLVRTEARDGLKQKQKSPKGNNIEMDEVFFRKLTELNEVVEQLRQEIAHVERIYRDILASPHTNTELHKQLSQLNQSIREKTAYVQANIKSLESTIKEKDTRLQSAQDRMRQAQHTALSKTFVDIMHLYNEYQVDYRNRCKSRIYKLLSVAGQTFSDEQVENMLEQHTPGVFTQFVIADTEAAKRSLSDIEARHTDLLQVEESIRELQDLFITLATIVGEQSPLVDRIENNISVAAETMQDARTNLHAARRSQKQARRRRAICIVICVVLLIVIAIVLVISLT